MDNIGVNIGYFNVETSRSVDMQRISAVTYKSTDKVKRRRKEFHAKKKSYTNVNQNDYGAGMH